MDLFKVFDNLEATVAEAALSVVQNAATPEFPDRSSAQQAAAPSVALSGTVAVGKARRAEAAWSGMDWAEHKQEWEHMASSLKSGSQNGSWQQRARHAEQQLLQLLERLLPLPDPLPLIENAASLSKSLTDAEAAKRQLQAELVVSRRDDQEVAALVKAHQQLEASHKEAQERLGAVQAELQAARAAAEAAQRLTDSAAEHERQATELKIALQALRTEHETAQSQLFELLSRQEEEAGGSARAEELLQEELEQAHRAVQQLTQQRDALQRQLMQQQQQQQQQQQEQKKEPQVSSHADSDPAQSSSMGQQWGLNGELPSHTAAASTQQLQALQQELQHCNARLQEAEASHQQTAQQLTSRAALAEAQVARLEHELSRRPHPRQHAELAARCDALAALVGAQLQDEGFSSSDAAAAAHEATPTSLAGLLQQRNSKLAEQLTSARQAAEAAAEGKQQLAVQVTTLEAQLADAQKLIAELEADLLRSCSAAGPGPAANSSRLQPLPSADLESAAYDAASSQQPEGMLQVVVAQRDRLRARLQKAEEELVKQQAALRDARSREAAALTNNGVLAEKIRYLEAYNARSGAAGAARGTARPETVVVRVDDAGVVQLDADDSRATANRYSCGPFSLELGGEGAGALRRGGGGSHKQLAGGNQAGTKLQVYAARINPYADFQASESSARAREPARRNSLVGGSMARTGAVLYLAVLHVFIMVLLYYSATPHHAKYTSSSSKTGQT